MGVSSVEGIGSGVSGWHIQLRGHRWLGWRRLMDGWHRRVGQGGVVVGILCGGQSR